MYFGCRDSNLYALDVKSGEKKWAFNNKGSWVISSPAVDKGRVYFSTSDTALFYALDAKTGTVVFSMKFTWPLFSSPTIAGNTIYLGSNAGKFMAIDLAAQKQAWTYETDASRQNGPAYTKPDGTPNYEAAFGFDFFYDDMVAGVKKMLTVGEVLLTPAIADNVIYVGSTDGNLHALNLSSFV